jgi:hypothetical protein
MRSSCVASTKSEMRRVCAKLSTSLGVALIVTIALVGAASAQADFAFVPGSLSATPTNNDGTIAAQAGSHPYAYTVSFSFKEDPATGSAEGGNPRDVHIEMPKGFVGYPIVGPRCSRQDFDAGIAGDCPPNTQVGVLTARTNTVAPKSPVFNLVPPPGVTARLGTTILGLNAIEDITVDPADGYRINVNISDIPEPILGATETLWGVPADPSHDNERGNEAFAEFATPSSSDAPRLPFLTLPTTCENPSEIDAEADSVTAPGVFVAESALAEDLGGNPLSMSGCERVPFSPSASALTTASEADSPTGLVFKLGLPNSGLLTPEGISETQPKGVEVTLPRGVVVNPSSAGGLTSCNPAQYAAETADSGPGQGCPGSSKIGTVLAQSPLLEEQIEGSVYLATPHENPFGSLLALYLVARAPERGVLIKQAGEVRTDPQTGQLTTTFDGLPPLPYSSFVLKLREGPRAPLATPQTCGSYATSTNVTPWSTPLTSNVTVSNSFAITSGPNGGPCPSGPSAFAPSLTAGTSEVVGGRYSPFTVSFSRNDGEQFFKAISVTTPPGLLGALKNVPLCEEPQASQGACSSASQIGHVTVAAGAGSEPIYLPEAGKPQDPVYLTGPYKGAPFGLSIVVPAEAGPFNLGTVVTRASIAIDPSTSQLTITSDPLPQILEGIPLQIRTVNVAIDRQGFMFNPTDCDPMAIAGTISSNEGASAAVSNHFQVANCATLPFKPVFSASTLAGGKANGNGASLDVKIATKQGPDVKAGEEEANIRKVDVSLPRALSTRLTTLQKACTEAQFAANPGGCPAESVVGTATVHTPVLPVPLVGPAYLVSHGGEAFPDLVLLLQGDGVEIALTGHTQIKKGITYSRFETVPDAPVSSFDLELPEKKNSILGTIENLCKPTKAKTVKKKVTERVDGKTVQVTKRVTEQVAEPLLMPTSITGQNGAVVTQSTKIAVIGCKKAPAKKPAKKRLSKLKKK